MPRKASLRRVSLPRRERLRVRELEEMFYFTEDLREYLKEELKGRGEEIEKKEKEAKEKGVKEAKERFFGKKFTIGQLVFFSWLLTFPMTGFWLWFLWPYLH